MAGFNQVVLMGNLTRDPELTYTASNTPICKFGLAVNRKAKDKEDVCFVDITAFGKTAETLNQYMTKGKPILLSGRLSYSTWKAKDGTNRSKLEVVAESFTFVGSKQDQSNPEPVSNGGDVPPANDPDADLPF